MLRSVVAIGLAGLVAGCTVSPDTQPPLATTPPGEAAGAAVTRRPLETPAVPPQAAVRNAPAALAVVVPPNTLYVCVIERNGRTQQTSIEFDPKVGKLCGTHPEMGPCQYERNNCRASGGRVFAANGVEITMATEAEYDRKVMRLRLRSN